MRLTFRAKFFLIVGAAAFAFLLLILVGLATSGFVDEQLESIEARYVPILELAPRLEAELELARRALQDAVAAQDIEALEAASAVKNSFVQHIDASKATLDPVEVAALRVMFEDYFDTAQDVSRRLITGETGEGLIESVKEMQAKHSKTTAQLKRATSFDRRDLTGAFATVRTAQRRAELTRFAIAVICLAFVLGLSLWISRGMLRALSELSAGFDRFGDGDFRQPMSVYGNDELSEVALEANGMAQKLQELSAQRDVTSWMQTGQAGLATELQGELSQAEVASRALAYLSKHVDAKAAALYLKNDDESLALLGSYALYGDAAKESPVGRFARAEGLIGQAALQSEIVRIDQLPADYLRVRSGLGEGSPRAVIIAPVLHEEKVTAIAELALLKPPNEALMSFLRTIRGQVGVALEVARVRAARQALLIETQEQAARLTEQEEKLRYVNEELQVQQEELRQTNEELADQARELDRQRSILADQNVALEGSRRHLEEKAQELAKVSAYKSQFLANMSHELRTPLNSMLLLSSMLAENDAGNLTEKQVEFSRTIHLAGQDLLALINHVLDLAKIEAGKHEVRIEEVVVRDFGTHAARIYSPLAKKKGLNFVVDVDPSLPETMHSDKQRIEQILTNLVGNAIKFTERGSVTLRIGRPAADVRFRRPDLNASQTIAFAVTDTGIGIAEADQQRAFAPFEQLDSRTERKYGGTGLGLAIARELAGLLGGEIDLSSEKGKGSTFVLYLPEEAPATTGTITPEMMEQARREPPAVAQLSARSIAPKPTPVLMSTPPPQGRATILLIEDDQTFAGLIAEIAAKQGHKVIIAKDGETGIRLAKEHAPQGIILDVRLPDIDGFSVMGQLRDAEATKHIPVHFISGLDASAQGLSLGAIGYLRKPASASDLSRVIESLAVTTTPRRRVLIVEDDALLGVSLMRALEGHEIGAVHVISAAEAMRALQTNERFGCMVLDLGLPDMDGLEFLETLRAQANVSALPVVVYTGRALSKLEVRRLEAYAEGVVQKEGQWTERLIEEIRMFLDHLKPTQASIREANALERQGRDLHLTGKKVLVADDDMRTVYALSALLRSKGIEVLVADTGVGALEVLFKAPKVDAVLMDIMMPEMDGYEAMRRIRADPRFRTLPVIALTAKAMKGDRAKCLEAGASDYMTKPIEGPRLLSLIDAWLAPEPPDAQQRRI